MLCEVETAQNKQTKVNKELLKIKDFRYVQKLQKICARQSDILASVTMYLL